MKEKDKELMSLLEAMRKGIATVESYIGYTPDYQEYIFEARFSWFQVGKFTKIFRTNMELGYNPFTIKKGVYLVADGFLQSRIGFMGKKDYDRGIEVSKQIAKLHSSKQFSGEGIELTKELWSSMPEKIRKRYYENERGTLVATHCHLDANRISSVHAHGFYEASRGEIGPIYLYDSKGDEKCFAFDLLPIVKLPSDIMIVVNNPEKDGTSRDKAFELVPNRE